MLSGTAGKHGDPVGRGGPGKPSGRKCTIRVESGVAISSTRGGKAQDAVTRPAFRKGLWRLTVLVLLNSLFEFLSLGLYRFWARSRLRRFYWNHAVIDGAPLEYDGRGIELLSGFLRTLALLLIPGGVVFVAAIALVGRGALVGPADFAFMLVLLPLIPMALYTARGYRLSRTYWRGIGFYQDGSAWRYTLIWMAWLMVCLLTIGLAVPWRNVAAQRYRVGHTIYGDMRFGFTGRGSGLIAAWIVPWLCGAGAAGFAAAAVLSEGGGRFTPGAPEWALGLALAFAVFFIRYRTVEFRYFARHTQLGPLRFRSRLRSPAVVTLILPHLAVAMGLIALNVALMVQLAQTVLKTQPAVMTADMVLFLGLLLLSILVLTILVTLSYNLLVRYGLLRAVCRSLEIENLHALADAAPAHAPRPRRGEGFAEAFDMGAL